jgi:Domain of unknown function (DUF4158)
LPYYKYFSTFLSMIVQLSELFARSRSICYGTTYLRYFVEDDRPMATRELLSPAQRAQMLCIPEDLSDQLLARYYTFSDDDLALIKQRRRLKNRLGFAVQLVYLRFPGRTWLASEDVPPRVLAYVADQLRVNPMSLVQYAQDREATRFEHLAELQRVYGFRSFSAQIYREMASWLLSLALTTDNGVALIEALMQEMRTRQILIPGITTLERLAWEVRRRARYQVYQWLTEGLTEAQRIQIRSLLTVSTPRGQSLLGWLLQPPGSASPASFQKVVERLRWIRDVGLDPQVRSRIHHNRLQPLRREGERMTAQRLNQLDETIPKRGQTNCLVLMTFIHRSNEPTGESF